VPREAGKEKAQYQQQNADRDDPGDDHFGSPLPLASCPRMDGPLPDRYAPYARAAGSLDPQAHHRPLSAVSVWC
jgi:hypothetical protein